MTGRYASSTEVPADRSRAELERLLIRYGASAFAYAWENGNVMIGFKMGERKIRMALPMPVANTDEFRRTPTGKARTPKAAIAAYEQEGRRRWRALLLVVKAKLEAIDSGITTLDDEFLSGIILSNGQTISDHLRPQIAEVYKGDKMPSLLPGGEREHTSEER